jgi:hypothetical protein
LETRLNYRLIKLLSFCSYGCFSIIENFLIIYNIIYYNYSAGGAEFPYKRQPLNVEPVSTAIDSAMPAAKRQRTEAEDPVEAEAGMI